jgi:hypothetical protein
LCGAVVPTITAHEGTRVCCGVRCLSMGGLSGLPLDSRSGVTWRSMAGQGGRLRGSLGVWGRVCLAGHWQVLTRDSGGDRPQGRWQRLHVQQLNMSDRIALSNDNNNMGLPSNSGSGLAQGGGASDRDVRIESGEGSCMCCAVVSISLHHTNTGPRGRQIA